MTEFGDALRRTAGWFGLTREGRERARQQQAQRRPPPLWRIALWVTLAAVGVVVLLTASASSVLERVGVGLLFLGGGAAISSLIRLSNVRGRQR